jgi:hypothetical protein
MMIDHEMLDTCAPALVCNYLCSAQVEVDPQGLALRQAASVFMAKIGSDTNYNHRGSARSRRVLRSGPAGFWPAARRMARSITVHIP